MKFNPAKERAKKLTQNKNEQLKSEFTGKQKFSFEGCICGGGDYTFESLNSAKETLHPTKPFNRGQN
jgi:hypothetical protein